MYDEMRAFRTSGSEMYDDFSEDALERAYKRGCKAGYRKAIEEVDGDRGSYSMRGGFRDDYRERSTSGSRSGGRYGERSWRIEEERGDRW